MKYLAIKQLQDIQKKSLQSGNEKIIITYQVCFINDGHGAM